MILWAQNIKNWPKKSVVVRKLNFNGLINEDIDFGEICMKIRRWSINGCRGIVEWGWKDEVRETRKCEVERGKLWITTR